MSDIAKAAGVSKATVSRALADSSLISQKTRKHIQTIADKMGYRNTLEMSRVLSAVRSGRKRQSRETIACIYPKSPDHPARPSFARALEGMMEVAEETGCDIDEIDLEQHSLNALPGQLQARGIQRVIFLHFAIRNNSEREWLKHFASTFQTALGCISSACGLTGDIVMPDLYEAGRICFMRAWGAGYRDMWLTKLTNYLDRERRFEAGFRLAMGILLDKDKFHYETTPNIRSMDIDKWLSRLGKESCLVGAFDKHSYEPVAKRLKRPNPPGIIDWHANLHHSRMGFSGIDRKDKETGKLLLRSVLEAGRTHFMSQVPGARLHMPEFGWIEGRSLPAVRQTHLSIGERRPFVEVQKESMDKVLIPSSALNSELTREFQYHKLIPVSSTGEDWIFQDVPFQIANNNRESKMLLIGEPSRWQRLRKNVVLNTTIPLEGKCKAFYFLHTAMQVQNQDPIAYYRFHYKNGDSLVCPIIPYARINKENPTDKPEGVNIQDWYIDYPPLMSKEARGVLLLNTSAIDAEAGYLYVFRKENPFPRKTLKQLEIQAAPGSQSLLIVYALTLGR